MTQSQTRQHHLELWHEAVMSGARRDQAARELGLSVRTLQRWSGQPADGRPLVKRPEPRNKLSDMERQAILAVCHQPTFASLLPPSQIVPRLADQGQYLASEATFYRVLKAYGQQHHRGRARQAVKRPAPKAHEATGPNQVWVWDISYLPSRVRGQFWCLYAILDVFSRKLVAWEVHERESGELASALLQRAVIRERCLCKPLILHADNGAPMTSSTLQAKLAELGITPSHSRPRVSNDNAYAESLFRTVKYCPAWPSQGFSDLQAAREWMQTFDHFYNHEHRHSGIRFVTPAQRHAGQDKALLSQREQVYEKAKARHPERWSGETRNWKPIGPVTLNPERSLAEAA